MHVNAGKMKFIFTDWHFNMSHSISPVLEKQSKWAVLKRKQTEVHVFIIIIY